MEEIKYPRQEVVLEYLKEHNIPFECYNHPEGKSIEEAKRWWHDDGSVHCKNIFMRNHKGKQGFCLKGVWELQSLTDPDGITCDYTENETKWMRIYDDSCYYMCQEATAPNGTMITPAEMASYTFMEKGQGDNH